MSIISRDSELHKAMITWRRDLHQHPEIAYTEFRTSDVIAQKLKGWGLKVHTGLAKTGVVATLRVGNSSHSIALRADMDALELEEKNVFSHKSVNKGIMHACGHDGHCAMLLGAAQNLSETRNFDGTIHFIFQPAEEGLGGGKVMVEEGLFEQFPTDTVYGLHNWPGLEVGQMAVRPGPIMAAADKFEIKVKGIGCHGAMPHLGVDPIIVSSQIVTALQTITSRNTDPLESSVVSVTQIHGGSAFNLIPDEVILRGTTRSFQPYIGKLIEERMRSIVSSICSAYGAEFEVNFLLRYPPTVNTKAETEISSETARQVVGDSNVFHNINPSMGAEDFSYMLQARPGCYIWLGNGPIEGGCLLHNSQYDFNDEALPIGASYWVSLAEKVLSS